MFSLVGVRRSAASREDQCGGLFRDHDDRRVRVAGYERRHDAAIDDAQGRRCRARAVADRRPPADRPPAPSCVVPLGWKIVPPVLRANSSRSSSVIASVPGRYSPATYGRDRARRGEPAREPDARDERRAILRRRQVVRLHRRRGQRIGRAGCARAARLGLQLAHRHRESREGVHRRARHVGRQRREMELHVGPRRVAASRARRCRPG